MNNVNLKKIFLALATAAHIAALTLSSPARADTVDEGDAPDRESVVSHRTHAVAGNRITRGDNWNFYGEGCNGSNTTLIRAGDTFSILFGDMVVNLQAGMRNAGTDNISACNVNIEFDPPAGMMLVGFQQVISGGVIKSEKSRVVLRANYGVAGRAYHIKPLIYERGVVQPTDANSVFSVIAENTKLPRALQCRERVKFHMRLQINGTRADVKNEYIMAGVDSLDGGFITNIRPVYLPCR